MKRRELLAGLGLTTLASILPLRAVHAAEKQSDATTTEPEMVEMLFVQNAHGVELKDDELILKGIGKTTIFFSDRPERITGHEPTMDFVEFWGDGDDSFASDPPNAVLSVFIDENSLEEEEPQDVVMILKSPRLVKGDLIYTVEVLDGPKKISGGASSLFIDTLGRPMSPGSVAGVHRRKRRRKIRRVTPGPR